MSRQILRPGGTGFRRNRNPPLPPNAISLKEASATTARKNADRTTIIKRWEMRLSVMGNALKDQNANAEPAADSHAGYPGCFYRSVHKALGLCVRDAVTEQTVPHSKGANRALCRNGINAMVNTTRISIIPALCQRRAFIISPESALLCAPLYSGQHTVGKGENLVDIPFFILRRDHAPSHGFIQQGLQMHEHTLAEPH